MITYLDSNSCQWIQFPYDCKNDHDTNTTVAPTEVTSKQTTQSTTTLLGQTSTRSSTIATKSLPVSKAQFDKLKIEEMTNLGNLNLLSPIQLKIATTPKSVTTKPAVTTPKTIEEIENNVLCDNSLEMDGWECSSGNKPGSLCVRFCDDNAFENKRCLCSSTKTHSNKPICSWTVKGKSCNEKNNPVQGTLDEKLGSLTSLLKYVDIVNTKTGNIHINVDLKHDKARQYL